MQNKQIHFFCLDPSVTLAIITGLANYKTIYGVPLCPCRNYHNEEDIIHLNYWICPCAVMRERKKCHRKLFLTSDGNFVSQKQEMDIEAISRKL